MQSLNMQSLKLCRTRGAAFVLLGTMVLLLAAMPLVQPASAMDCLQETLFYNDWENEELHAQSELFADTEHLPWGTEVCPIGNRQRWLTNWTEVRLEDGRMGWIDAADLVSATEFRDSIHLRHAAAVVELNSLVAEVDDIEVVMRKRGIAVPELNLNIVLLSWLRAGSKPAAVPAAVSEPLLEDVDEPTPMPTVLPSPTPFPTPVPDAISDPMQEFNCHNSELMRYLARINEFMAEEPFDFEAYSDFLLEYADWMEQCLP